MSVPPPWSTVNPSVDLETSPALPTKWSYPWAPWVRCAAGTDSHNPLTHRTILSFGPIYPPEPVLPAGAPSAACGPARSLSRNLTRGSVDDRDQFPSRYESEVLPDDAEGRGRGEESEPPE